MKIRQELLVILLAISMALSITACGGEKNNSDSSTAEVTTTTTSETTIIGSNEYRTDITELSLGGELTSKDIANISKLYNLETLHMENIRVSNGVFNTDFLKPLVKLKDLTLAEISLPGNKMGDAIDLSGISYLVELERLSLHNSAVYDITALESLANLKELYLSKTGVNDLSPLKNYKKLEVLSIDRVFSDLTDLSPLSKITSLKVLSMEQLTNGDISALGSLINLEELNMYMASYDKDISAIGKMVNLRKLNLGYRETNDISFLGNLKNLEELDVQMNFIEDISPLVNLNKLRILKMGDAYSIQSISPLAKLTKLENLEVCVALLDDRQSQKDYFENEKKLIENSLPNTSLTISVCVYKKGE